MAKRRKVILIHKKISHGMSKTREYRVWADMQQRCSNLNSKRYPRYGGRGISICDRWQQFENFFEDMGPRPSMHHSIDRKDNDGNYDPSNCRWATRSQQQNNKCPYPKNNRLPKGDEHWTRKDRSRAADIARKNIENAGSRRGIGNGNARLSEAQVITIKRLIASGIPDTAISQKFGVRPGTIWFIRSKKHWSHVQ